MPETPPAQPTLTRRRVLEAGVALADRGGLETLTMRSLGGVLGVQGMALYNHVANKADLLSGMIDLVVGEMYLPLASRPWRSEMRERGTRAHEVLLRHPWACPLLLSGVHLGPAMFRYVDATVGCLRSAGFSIELTDHAWNALDSHVYGFTMQLLQTPLDRPELPPEVQARLADAAPTHPHLAEMAHHVMAHGAVARHSITFGLDLILDGLETLAPPAAGPRLR